MGKYKYILAFLAAMICLVIYIITLQPGVTFMDSGELGGALYTFGIPHPTGYPLYLVIGYIASNLPFGGTPIYKLNLLSALFSSATVFVLYFAFYNILVLLNNTKENKPKGKEIKTGSGRSARLDDKSLAAAAFFSALLAGLSRTFWNNATFAEVYPLHILLVSLVIYYCTRAYVNQGNPRKKDFVFIFLFLGLSFANHMMTVLLLPGILYLFYLLIQKSQHAKKLITSSIIFILPGLLLYLILVFRASAQPFFNWSSPDNFANLWHHITGGDYSQVMLSGGSAFSNNLKIFGSSFINEYAILASVIGLIGAVTLYKKQRQLFYFFALAMICSLLYALSYSIRDVEVYFVQFFLLYGFFTAAGLAVTASFIAVNMKSAEKTLPAVAVSGVILVIFTAYYNFSYNNNSKNYVTEDLTLNTINSLKQGAVLVTYDWGFTYPAALYYQQAENKRMDLKVFNIKFLAAPWHLENIKKYYPDVYNTCSAEIGDYIKNYSSGDARVKAGSLSNLVKAFLAKNGSAFTLYVTIDLLINREIKPLLAGMDFIPDGLVYRYVKSQQYDSTAGVESLSHTFRNFTPDTPDKQKVYTSAAGMYYETAFYHYRNKNSSLALKFADKSLSINSSFADALNLKNKILSEQK